MNRDLKWVEIARTMCIAGVIFIHSTEMSYLPSEVKTWYAIGISAILRFIVPTFFIISGFLLGRSYLIKNKKFEFIPFWRKKLPSIVVPFFLWNVIYMLMYNLLEGWEIVSWNTLWLLLTGYIHLFYIFVLIQFFLLYSLLHPYLSRRNLKFVLIASAVGSLLFYLLSEILLRQYGPDGYFFEWHYGKTCIAWGLFFFWGMWLCDHLDFFEKISRRLWALGFASALSFLLYFWELWGEEQIFGYDARQYFLVTGLIFQFIAANFLLALLYRMSRKGIFGKQTGYMVTTGKDTYGIYLSHLLFLTLLIALWEVINLPEVLWLKVGTVFIATWVLSQSLVRLCRYPQFSLLNRFLFGSRK